MTTYRRLRRHQSFDRASLAIKYAHDWATSSRFTAIIAKRENWPPAAIYRRKVGMRFDYVVASSWEESPEGVGPLVMIVSASGIEKLEGPWMDEGGAFAEAIKR